MTDSDDQQATPAKPNLATPDFQNTLEGQVPGNVSAEHGTLPGADPNAVTEGRTPDDVKTADPTEVESQQAEARDDQEAKTIAERQVAEYTGADDKGAA
jgi:hypothetical protein